MSCVRKAQPYNQAIASFFTAIHGFSAIAPLPASFSCTIDTALGLVGLSLNKMKMLKINNKCNKYSKWLTC